MTRAVPPAPARGASLRVGRVNDAHEVAADRAAHRALAGGAPRPVPPAAAAPPAPRLDAASGGLAARIADARTEGQDLPAAQRAFFAPRFGHRFDGVRIHAGPAAAAVASAARAQAFTFGRDIYFGDGRYRPDSGAGQELLAHELAHTLQDRPNVVARRALDGAFDPPESDPAAGAGPGRVDSEPAVDELATLVQAGPTHGNQAAREKLDGLDPAMRSDALATLGSRLPAAERGKVAALGKQGQTAASQPPAPPNSMPEVRATDTAPAPVTTAPAPDAQAPTPAHAQVASAAAAKMQQAVNSVGAEAPVEGAPALPGSLDTGAVPAEGQGGGPPSTGAAAAAQRVAATLGARIAELQGVQSLPVQFREDPQAPQGDPEAFARSLRSQSLATRFASGVAEQIQGVLSAAAAVPAQAMAALGGARQAIAAQAATQGAALQQGAAAARKQIRDQAARVRGAIAARHATADTDVARNVQDANGRATRAHDTAAGGLARRAETEKRRIALSYDDALQPMIGVGIEAGGRAQDAAEARAQSLLSQRDGESSVLDGPLHDDRLEASADASRKVGEEYAKSFRETASQQADRLPESRPEILGKVDEITGQARTGFGQQLAQITQGATALETGAKARSRQAATQMRAALDANATQSQQALDAAEAQQGAALQGQADAAQSALDQSVAAALTSFGDGVGRAAQQLAVSLRTFVDSAAGMPPPDTDELAAALAESDPSAALTAMGAQVATVVPTLSGTLTEGQQASGAALEAAVASAAQGFTGSAAAFVMSAGSLNQQSATGFRQLGVGNTRSATNLATDAEAGFADAVTNADAAYSQFGDQVEDNFRTGRLQMRDGLWSQENQAKLAEQMKTSGQDAADHVKPRWKRVLKWVVMIVVIVAVIVVTVLSAGALGPVGVILLGAALGAAAGAVQTIADNLIDGEPWSKGVVKAMIVGAVGGAVGGAGGVLLKGVGSVGLRIALEGGVNIIGGVAGEALGSVATGQTVDWTGALMGALVGAGIGAGLGIAGAIRGRIRVGGIGEPAAPPPPRPTIEAPPPAPAGRIRTALEGAKILAPRPAPVMPEVNVGAGATGETPPSQTRELVGFGDRGTATERPPSDTRDLAGFGDRGTATERPPSDTRNLAGFGDRGTATERPPSDTRNLAGFGDRGTATERPPSDTRNLAGFGDRGTATERPPSDTRNLAGFGDRGTATERPPSDTRNLAGFGDRGTATNPRPTTGETPVGAAREIAPPPPPRAMIIEPPPPRAVTAGGPEPIRAGGRGGLEIRASGEPAGPSTPKAVPRDVGTPRNEAVPQPAPGEPAPAPPAPRPATPEGAPPPPARRAGVGGSGPRGPSAGSTAEGEGAAFQYEYHPETPSPKVTRGRGSGVRPEASAEPVSPRPAPVREAGSGVGEALGGASEGTATAGRSPAGPDELNAANPALAAEVQAPGGPRGFSPRQTWEPPPGAPRRPPASAPLEARRAWLRQRLETHIDQAVERYQVEGLTPGQEAALGDHPQLQPAFRGSRIDQFGKDSIMQDAELAEIITAPDFVGEPDILDSVLPDWFDMTTRAAWADHLRRYAARYGNQAHLLDIHR